mgnify:CR=1 FL=1
MAKVIKVVAFGMDTRSTKMLDLLFREKGVCEVVAVKDADVALFDMDGAKAEEEWHLYQNSEELLPTIIVSIRPLSVENAVFVRKPISITALSQALRELSVIDPTKKNNQKMQPPMVKTTLFTKTVAKAMDDRVSESNATATASLTLSQEESFLQKASATGIHYDPKQYVLGSLLDAMQQATSQGCAVKLECKDKIYICYDPNKDEILSDVPNDMLRDLGVIKIDKKENNIKCEMLNNDAFNAFRQATDNLSERVPAQAFIWELALFTARGRIPKLRDANQVVYLRHWPNLTRLARVPYCLPIIALWINQPQSLQQISDTLDVPIENVFNIYSMAEAIGLTGPTRRQADHFIAASSPKDHPQRGLLSSILQKLRGLSK